MPDLGPCFRGILARAFLRFFTLSMPKRRCDRHDRSVGVPPMPARSLLDGLGAGRWTFRWRRLRSWHNNLGLHRSAGQLEPVALRRFIRCKRRLYLALILRGFDDQRSRRRSNLDRYRWPQANDTKKGEPHPPGHFRTQCSYRVEEDGS